MVDVDWRSIARVGKLMGGEGANLLQLKSKAKYKPETLNAATPEDLGDSPANGGWFSTPTGPMLFLEGLPDVVNPWVEQLALRFADARIEGTLAGGRSVNETTIKWAMELQESVYSPRPGQEDRPVHHRWCGLLGYRSVPNWWEVDSHWTCGPDSLNAATAHAFDWMSAKGGRVLANVDLRADFWVDRPAAEAIFTSEAERRGTAVSKLFSEERSETRQVTKSGFNEIALIVQSSRTTWQEMIAELRAALIAAPLQWVSIAMISQPDWGGFSFAGQDAYYDRAGYHWYPHRWDEFTLDACGIQILTDRHLARANDLTAWQTTRLDAQHFLVESRDLDAWYARPLRWNENVDAALIARARSDFGEMILTPAQAKAQDMVGNPRFK